LRLICFDQSTAIVGWSIFDDKVLVDYGLQNFKKFKSSDQKVSEIKKWMTDTIVEKKAEVFAIEDIQFQGMITAYRSLAELIGVIKSHFYDNDYAYIIVKNGEWKKYCEIKGRKRAEQKANAQKFVKNKYNIDVAEDVCDAICIGEYVVNKILK
jgi:Holliday junction resolvasome RuvABC endonuclease subunit